MHRAAPPRRTLATRNAGWARRLARGLGQIGATPNAVSMASVAIAFGAGAAFVLSATAHGTTQTFLLLAAAAGIQLRLLCNLLDGMLAVEEGLKTPTGDIYNDVPDRIADVVILVSAGYAANGLVLGWNAAACALFTAYVRTLAGSLGATQHFVGPMAKPHRMFTLTLGAIAAAAGMPFAIPTALAIIVAGSIVTAARRVSLLAAELEAR